MNNLEQILSIIKSFIFIINIFLALIYSLTILIHRRFHQHSNILTLNLSIAFLFCCIYWFIYCILLDYSINDLYDKNSCTFIVYAQMLCTCQLAFALIIIPIHRFFSIVYHTKLFFQCKQWTLICIIIQWIFGFVVSSPLISKQFSDCVRPHWTTIYRMMMIVIIPSIISLCINTFLLISIRSSIRQIHPSSSNISYKPKINHHDIRFLKHMIYMFAIFIIGLGPIFLLMVIDYQGDINPIIYLIFIFLAEGSLLSIIINLFKYNQKLRRYLKWKFFSCF